MILQVPSRERSHIPPNGKRKIIDSKVPIPRSELQLGETLYHILLELLDLWNLHILKRPKCPGSCLFALYIYIYMCVRYRVPPKKKKLSRVATFLGSTLTTNRSSQVVCSFFAVFSCYVVLKQPEPSPKVFANNRHTRIMILPTHTTALLPPQSLT